MGLILMILFFALFFSNMSWWLAWSVKSPVLEKRLEKSQKEKRELEQKYELEISKIKQERKLERRKFVILLGDLLKDSPYLVNTPCGKRATEFLFGIKDATDDPSIEQSIKIIKVSANKVNAFDYKFVNSIYLEIATAIFQNQTVQFERLADIFADYCDAIDSVKQRTLPIRAEKSADLVKKLRAEKRALTKEIKIYQNILGNYEAIFPWLEEFKEVDYKQAFSYIDAEEDEDYEPTKNWLSPVEYDTLSVIEKNQLALDRYKKRKKSDWDIGIEYERYVGYLYEKKGYSVTYTGATQGLQDMGRDLIAEKGDDIYVIQCKRWAKEKTIHEKHIFQLFGTGFVLSMKEKKKTVHPVFYTTTTLSKLAKSCAKKLDIEVFENFDMEEYPLIKCNIGHSEKGKEKIYHLPFDQQYDRIIIQPKKGEKFVSTVQEAEDLGFRRALRHRVQKQ